MLRSYLTHAELIEREPQLSDYLRDDQINFNTIIDNAKSQLISEMKNRGKELRKLCATFTLTDATKSDEDEIERTRLFINVSAITDNATWVFEGTNDQSSESWTTILNSIQASELGEYTYTFDNTFKYYRLTKNGTVTYTAYLVERSFEQVHLYLALSLVYKSLENLTGDMYGNKAQFYMDLYFDSLETIVYSYDENLDGSVNEDELKQNRVMFRR